jgi:hypothetical protein
LDLEFTGACAGHDLLNHLFDSIETHGICQLTGSYSSRILNVQISAILKRNGQSSHAERTFTFVYWRSGSFNQWSMGTVSCSFLPSRRISFSFLPRRLVVSNFATLKLSLDRVPLNDDLSQAILFEILTKECSDREYFEVHLVPIGSTNSLCIETFLSTSLSQGTISGILSARAANRSMIHL